MREGDDDGTNEALHEKERKQMESEIASLEPSILRECKRNWVKQETAGPR